MSLEEDCRTYTFLSTIKTIRIAIVYVQLYSKLYLTRWMLAVWSSTSVGMDRCRELEANPSTSHDS